MRKLAEKLKFMNTRAVKLCAKAGIRGCSEPKSAAFDVNPQGKCLGKEKA